MIEEVLVVYVEYGRKRRVSNKFGARSVFVCVLWVCVERGDRIVRGQRDWICVFVGRRLSQTVGVLV